MISEQQSAYVLGRLIQDNSILTHEIFHALSLNRSQSGTLALKINMSKAYDRMEWNLIRLALKLFGFSSHWIHACLSSVSYSILLNGYPYGFITPTRGMRQGDPLSPFLFAIGMKILSCLIDKAYSLALIHGVRLSRDGCTQMIYLFLEKLNPLRLIILVSVWIYSLSGLVKHRMHRSLLSLSRPIQIVVQLMLSVNSLVFSQCLPFPNI